MAIYNITLIDDHPIILNGITSCFSKYTSTIQLHLFSDSNELFDFLQGNKSELLLTDLSMPNLNGYEIIQQARQIQPNIKVEFLLSTDR